MPDAALPYESIADLAKGFRAGRIGKVDLPVLARREHPVDDSAVEVDMGVRGAA
jgi:hypothetical protein